MVTASDDKTARIWDVRWLTRLHGNELVTTVCREKLVGASRLTTEDVRNAPRLRRPNRRGCLLAPTGLIPNAEVGCGFLVRRAKHKNRRVIFTKNFHG